MLVKYIYGDSGMIKRAKRNYIIVIMMSCFMLFTITHACIGFEQALSYGETNGIVRSVNVREVEGGSYDDRFYYTESTVGYDYTIDGRDYTGTTDLRDDYTGREGDQVTVIYNKSNPWKSDIGSQGRSLYSGITSLIGSVVLLVYVIRDIISWAHRRKEENAQIAWQSYSSDELLALSMEKKRKKRISILLYIVSVLCTFLLLFFAIPLWIFTIARAIDVKLCYPDLT